MVGSVLKIKHCLFVLTNTVANPQGVTLMPNGCLSLTGPLQSRHSAPLSEATVKPVCVSLSINPGVTAIGLLLSCCPRRRVVDSLGRFEA